METCLANKFSKTTIEIHRNLQVSGPPSVFSMLFIPSFIVLSGYFYVALSVIVVIPLFEF